MREERRCGFIARMPEDHAAGSARASNNLRVFSNASWNRAASNSLNSSPFPPSASVSPVPLDPSFRQERRPSCLDRGMCTAECRHANATKKLLTRVVCRGSPVSGQRQRLSISYSFARSFHLSSPLFTPSLLLPFVRSFVRSYVPSFPTLRRIRRERRRPLQGRRSCRSIKSLLDRCANSDRTISLFLFLSPSPLSLPTFPPFLLRPIPLSLSLSRARSLKNPLRAIPACV